MDECVGQEIPYDERTALVAQLTTLGGTSCGYSNEGACP